jgi:uncharacterized protein YjdB
VLSHSAHHGLRLVNTTVAHSISNNTFKHNAHNGILLDNAGSGATISNNTSRNNTHSGIHIINSSPSITRNAITANPVGIFCENNANPVIGGAAGQGNDITGNTFGVQNVTVNLMVYAKYNFWGAASGPRHAANPSGTGDRVSDHVEYSPFLTFSALITDAQAVAADKAALNFDVIKGANTAPDNVIANLTLPVSGASGTAIAWQSSDPAILGNDGKVTRPSHTQGDRQVTLTATISRGTASDTRAFSLTVKAFPPVIVSVTGVTVDPISATINVGGTLQLTATVLPANATNNAVTWSSSAPAIATVSSTGLVVGVSAGTAVITVTTADNNRTAASAITVVVPVTGVTIDPTSATINIGDTRQLTAAVSPADATNKAATWSSNAPAVATVSPTGLVSGVSAGTAVITVTTVDGNRTATSTINVVAPTPAPAPVAPTPAPPIPTPTVVEWPVVVGQITIGEIEDVVEINVPAGAIIGESPKIIPQVLSETAAALLIAAAAEVGLTAASKVLELTLTGGEFRNKVQLELDFDAAKVPRGQVPSVFAYNERTDRWIYLGGQVGEGVVTVTIDRFHKTAVFAANPLPPLADAAAHWGRSSITTLAGMGIVSGFPDGRFNPNAGVTRAEFVSMLTRALNLRAKPEAAVRFTDAVGWAQGAIGAAVEAGLVEGFPDGSFSPARQITRDELAAILARVVERRLVPVGNAEEIMFADAAAIPAWARDAVRSAITAGLVRGYPDRTFRPGATTTRAEATVMLYRLVAER